VDVALQNCHRLGRLIDEVLEVSRLEQGVAQRHLEWTPVRLAELVHKVVQFVRTEAAMKGLRVVERLPADLPPMVGDERLMHLLLFNLIENAIKFTGEGGCVEVELEHHGDEVVARVRDTGIGIRREHHDRIFEKFFTVDGGAARTHGGAGIGLYLAKEVVAIHDGAIRVDSTAGEGAMFEVKLPLRPQR
jgi:two-component system phosphate regulon sensor histidine kinase PhoR